MSIKRIVNYPAAKATGFSWAETINMKLFINTIRVIQSDVLGYSISIIVPLMLMNMVLGYTML